MKFTRAACAVAASLASVALVAGCSGSTPGDSAAGADGTGPFTLVIGKDTSGKLQSKVIDLWNKEHPDAKAKVIELPASADEQRAAIVQNFQAHSDRFDAISADVVWTSEFAARGWIQKIDPSGLPIKDMLPAAVKTAQYKGDLYGAPITSAGALLFYRKDLISKPPTTWKDLIDDCRIAKQHNMGCYAGQFAKYEGLTVNATEAINSAGGSVYGSDGSVTVDSPQAKAGLDFLVNGFKQGYIPKSAITYQEEDARRAFQQGKLLFLRNWPYVYSLANAGGSDSVIKGKFGMAPLPGANGVGSTTLGGNNLVLSSYSKHKKSVEQFMAFMESPAVQRVEVEDLSNSPVLTDLYTDKKLVAENPYLPILKEGLLHGAPRPQVPAYDETSLRIQTHVYDALTGKKDTAAALKELAADLRKIPAN
ncbi:ABC transporter substrate-binding protein [Streptomyces chiangmaiensis]|uniref:ABC transporter substrate-binding protein n=1 Tax=Streptomyces chiangmaiensis TaxID=766497 RepID=A0ABU7FRS7_9ACTN|nr:ABC transporter substrate-binding protein [Streptomyces chiangmaiensis]MED7826699.1 ABC transporter substrate-binding protein [Streptomyces chiangmaiensis]